MKVGFFASLTALVALLGVLAWSMGRISELKDEVAALKEDRKEARAVVSSAAPRTNTPGPVGSARSGTRVEKSNPRPAENEDPEEAKDNRIAVVGEFFRELMELEGMEEPKPEEGQKAAEKVFSTFMDELGLDEAERAQFLEIVGPAMEAEDKLWEGIIMARTDQGKQEVLKKWQEAETHRDEQLKEFLNSDDHYGRYQQYEARREEYEQIEGLREALTDAEAPLTAAQEGQLVEAMFTAREESGMNDRWEGAAVIDQLSRPGLADRMKEDWNLVQNSVNTRVSTILSDEQQAVFDMQQERTLRELSVGLRFVEAMTGNASDDGGGLIGTEEDK